MQLSRDVQPGLSLCCADYPVLLSCFAAARLVNCAWRHPPSPHSRRLGGGEALLVGRRAGHIAGSQRLARHTAEQTVCARQLRVGKLDHRGLCKSISPQPGRACWCPPLSLARALRSALHGPLHLTPICTLQSPTQPLTHTSWCSPGCSASIAGCWQTRRRDRGPAAGGASRVECMPVGAGTIPCSTRCT